MQHIITRESALSLDQVCARLPEIATKHKFGVLGTHDLKEKMLSKGVPFDRECRVFEVCNPQQAQAILQRSIHVASALPCRISAYTENGRTVLGTIKPAALLGLFGGTDGEEIAREVETSLVRIMEEACASAEK
jgi:uncharacterized protein (DUF302 family)